MRKKKHLQFSVLCQIANTVSKNFRDPMPNIGPSVFPCRSLCLCNINPQTVGCQLPLPSNATLPFLRNLHQKPLSMPIKQTNFVQYSRHLLPPIHCVVRSGDLDRNTNRSRFIIQFAQVIIKLWGYEFANQSK